MTANLADLLAYAAAESPDKVAVVEAGTGRRITWAQLDAEVDAVAAGLDEMGLVAGYRVVIVLGNRVEFVTCYLGILRARLVAVPVNPRSATGELVRMLADCTARAVVADPATIALVRAAVAGVQEALTGADADVRARAIVPRVLGVDVSGLPGETSYDDLVGFAGSASIPPAQDPDALAVLLYTSGTSGRPRAAMLTHRALLANIDQVARLEPTMVAGDDVVFGVLPLFHVYGLNAVLGQVLRQRSTLVLSDGFDPEGSLDTIEDEAVSVLPVAPAVFAHWSGVSDLAERLSGVRMVLSGSAPLSPEVSGSFAERTGLTVHEGYGLTEAAPVVTSTLGSSSVKPGSVGPALPGMELRLVDEDGREPEGEDPGEIAIRGDNLFSGYWPDGVDGPEPDGWFATGDVGFLDSDGDLFLVDRLRDLVIVSGFNVYPSEVEEVIAEVSGVAEAAVIGAAEPSTGEMVVAYVVAAESSSLSSEELAQAVREHCAVRLARFKQPSAVEVVEELPHTGTGKVAKGRLRASQRRHTGLLE